MTDRPDYIPADDHVTTGDASELAAQARFSGSHKPSVDNPQCSNTGAGEQDARATPTGGSS